MTNSMDVSEPSPSTAPSPPNFIVISYPAYVKNVDKAVETLGGYETISKKHSLNRPLELRLSIDNPFAGSLLSERIDVDKSSNTGKVYAVLKVRRKKFDRNIIQTKILGPVSSIYTFPNMCDFTYLPVRKSNISDEHCEDLTQTLLPHDLSSALNWWTSIGDDGDASLFLPPIQFSRFTTPSRHHLCLENFTEDRTTNVVGLGQNLRTERKSQSITVQACDDFPTAPSAKAIEFANLKFKEEFYHRSLQELFEKRPIWTRAGIVKETGFDSQTLKFLIFKFAFYISSGAWGRCWCRFGYDPRKEPEAAKYQTIMVNFRQHCIIPIRQRLKMDVERKNHVSTDEPIDYSYTPGKLPCVRQMWYCICDVKLPIAERFSEDQSHLLIGQMDPYTGWIPAAIIEEIRNKIKDDVSNVSGMISGDLEGESDDDDRMC